MRNVAALLLMFWMIGRPAGSSAEELTGLIGSNSPDRQDVIPAGATFAPISAGDHGDFGRLVFQWERQVEFEVSRQGDKVTIRFPRGMPALLQPVHRSVRNVLRIALVHNGIEVELLRGARIRTFRDANRIVVDLLNPAPRIRKEQAVRPTGDTRRAQEASFYQSANALPAAPDTAPGPTVAVRQASSQHRIVLPFDNSVGATFVQCGDAFLLVFDQRRPEDLAAIGAQLDLESFRMLDSPEATLLSLKPKPGISLRLRLDGHAWILQTSSQAAIALKPPTRVEAAAASINSLSIRTTMPGRVLTVTDPETGLPLLLGTARHPARRGGVEARHFPFFDVLPSQIGVAVLARSDQVSLHPELRRFIVTGPPVTSPHSDSGPDRVNETPTELSRSFDFPALSIPALQHRLELQEEQLRTVSIDTQRQVLVSCAETLLSLGRGSDAQHLLQRTTDGATRGAADPKIVALRGAAALVAGDLLEAADLEVGPASAELGIWRALRAAALGTTQDLDPLASLPRLLSSYPEPLQTKLLSIAVDALANHGEVALLQRLLSSALPRASKEAARDQLADNGAVSLARKQDWPGATNMLMQLAEITVPSGPEPLTQAQRRMLTRLAAYAALAGEEQPVRVLRDRYAARMQVGSYSTTFSALITDPLRALALLPQLQQDIGLVRFPTRSGGGSATP